MVHIPKVQRRKWDKKAAEMIFVGYADTQKGFRCFDPSKRKAVISSDVCFMESKAAKIDSNLFVDLSDDDNEDEESDSNAVGAITKSDETFDNTEDVPTESNAVGGGQPEETCITEPEDGEVDEFDDAISDRDYLRTDGVIDDNRLRCSKRSYVPKVRPDFVSIWFAIVSQTIR